MPPTLGAQVSYQQAAGHDDHEQDNSHRQTNVQSAHTVGDALSCPDVHRRNAIFLVTVYVRFGKHANPRVDNRETRRDVR